MLSRFFIQRPKFALVISIILTLAGAISLMVLPVQNTQKSVLLLSVSRLITQGRVQKS